VKSLPLVAQILVSLLFTAIGVWIMITPLVVGYQDMATDWIPATKNDVFVGGALVLVSVGLLIGQITATVRARLRALPAAV
jgi:hypothetical protein